VPCSFKHGNKMCGTINGEDVLDQINDYRLLKKKFAP
jgi:hypothetical protein